MQAVEPRRAQPRNGFSECQATEKRKVGFPHVSWIHFSLILFQFYVKRKTGTKSANNVSRLRDLFQFYDNRIRAWSRKEPIIRKEQTQSGCEGRVCTHLLAAKRKHLKTTKNFKTRLRFAAGQSRPATGVVHAPVGPAKPPKQSLLHPT